MTDLEKLFIDYKIISDGLYRRYLFNALERRYDLENSKPIYFHILDSGDPYNQLIVSKSWVTLLKKLFQYLQNFNPKTNDELLSFNVDWSKSSIFLKAKTLTNSCPINDELFLNTNHTSLHLQWLIGDLLEFYGIEKAYLLIHKAHKTEPKEIRNAIETYRKNEFQYYLKEKNINPDKIIKTIDVVNKIFNKMGYAYDNFYLFDSRETLHKYKKLFLDQCKKYIFWDDNEKAFINKCLNYLCDYYSQIKVESAVSFSYE